MNQPKLCVIAALLMGTVATPAATDSSEDAEWAQSVNLLKLIQPEQNTVWGKWHMDRGALLCEESGSARLEIPYSLPEEYDFRIKFTPVSGRQEVRQILAKSGHQFIWSIGADGKPTYGFGLINGKKANDNRTTIKNGPGLEPGVAYESVVQVRKDGLKAFLNGELIAQWKTDYQDVSMVSGWGLHNSSWLGLGTYNSCVRFHRIDLREVTGQGQSPLAGAKALLAPLPGQPVTRADLLRATEAAIAGAEFVKHMDFLDNLVLTNFKLPQGATGMAAWDRVLTDATASLAIAQVAVLHWVTPETLAAIAKADVKIPGFLTWFLGDRDAMEAFLNTLKLENEPAKVLPLWAALWGKDPADGAKYANLALACAVVFDKPLRVKHELDPQGLVEVGARYDYFRNNDKQHQLKTDLTKLPAWELVWVVDAPVPGSELEWALKNIHLPRDSWAHAYDMVEYRMAKVTQNAQLYDRYTLAEILKKGGICGDRAYFASVTAKAHGIPAIMLVGEGQRGGHAWFAYKATAKWNMAAGRYESDQFATGYAIDPQTRHSIKEQTLNFLTDGQRRVPEYDKASRLVWLAGILMAHGQTPQAGSLLDTALAASSRHMAAWDAYFKFLKLTNASKDRWKAAVQTARSNFRGYPDMLARLDTLETETVLDPANVDDIIKSLHAQVRKLESRSKERSDLILETIERHLKLLRASDDATATQTIYEKTLKEFGGEVPVYEALAKKYFAFARAHNLQKKAFDAIEAIFRKYYTAPTQDYFEISKRARLQKMIAGFYRADGQDAKAAALDKKAGDMETRAAAAHKNDR